MKRFPYFFAISDELNIQLALSNSNLKGKKSFELKRELHYIFIWKGNYYFIFTVTLNMFKL